MDGINNGDLYRRCHAKSEETQGLGFVWIAVAFIPLAILSVLIYVTISSPITLWNSDDTFLLVMILAGFALMPFLVWATLANAVHRFSTSRMENRYFRVGPDGISVCVSEDDAKAVYLFKHESRQVDLMWFQIKEWHPTYSEKSSPSSRTIVFKTIHEVAFHIPTYNFAENQSQIMDNIRDAIKTIRDQQADPYSNTLTFAEIRPAGSN